MSLSRQYLLERPYHRIESWLITKKPKLLLVALHAGVGFFVDWGSGVSTVWALALILLGTYFILVTRNRTGWAHYFASYVMSLELFLRMTHARVFWEFGKYTVVYFLVLGLLFRRTYNKKAVHFLIYFYFLIPAIFIVDPDLAKDSWRELISFNLSGPLTLCIAAIYFYKYKLTLSQFEKLATLAMFPLITILFYLIRHLINLGSVTFSAASNYKLSGGFGPNQVSTVLGFAFMCIIVMKLLKTGIFKNAPLDWLLTLGFLIFSILTFSRGGVVSGVLASAFCFFIFHWGKQRKKIFYKNLFLLLIGVILVTIASNQINLYTEGFLGKRYLQHDEKHSRFTGRETLLAIEKQMFRDHLLTGVGVGMAASMRKTEYGYHKSTSSHTEFSRMLAEHGLLGLASLIIMLYLPFIHFVNLKNEYSRLIFSAFMGYSLLTISHSAMRLSMPCLLYGMSFMTLTNNTTDEA